MQRRKFLQNGVLGSAAALVGSQSVSANTPAKAYNKKAIKTFTCDYAPHFGMFENNAGKDLIDQLKYMHDQGFRSMEDNGMMSRPVDVQEKIGQELKRLGMRMGVFVIDGGDSWKTSLTTGKQEFTDNLSLPVVKLLKLQKGAMQNGQLLFPVILKESYLWIFRVLMLLKHCVSELRY